MKKYIYIITCYEEATREKDTVFASTNYNSALAYFNKCDYDGFYYFIERFEDQSENCDILARKE